MIPRPTTSTRTDTLFPYTRSSDPGYRVALNLRFDCKFDSARFQYLLTAPQLAFGKTRFLDLRGEGEGRISREGATLIPLNMRARRMIGQGAVLDGIFNNQIGRASCRERVCQYG